MSKLRLPIGSRARLLGAAAVVLAVIALLVSGGFGRETPVPAFGSQACALPLPWLERIERGYFEPRSGQISLLPRWPAYMASGAGGWSHSGPWRYLAHVPLVFYGPGLVDARGAIDRAATTADIAPTIAALLRRRFPFEDGRTLPEVARPDADRQAPPPKLVVTVVWDGGGYNVLRQWPRAWPHLRRLMRAGVSYTRASVGSSPSVTPAVHTTLGTGDYPWRHGITGVPVRDEKGEVVDSFLQGESGRFVKVPTLAERWDEANGNHALIGMVGYEPWHLGMIGQGAERAGGDRDDAAWLDIETNEWITNPAHYRLPQGLRTTGGLQRDLRATDAADGRVDGAWRDNAILDDPARIEEVPGFVHYQTRALENVIAQEGYGGDDVADLLFTNYKQIDRDGHYYNMASPEVRDTVVASDEALGELVRFLNDRVGRGNYLVVVTADHGQQPDARSIDGYGIDPNEVEADIDARFGRITRAVWPTEAFLYADEMRKREVTVAQVARFLGAYTLRDNTKRPDVALSGSGRFDPEDRLFAMAIPSTLLPTLDCR